MMRKYAYGLRLLLALVLASGIFVTAAPMQMEAKETQAYTTQDLNEQLVMATLWMQTSAEFRALCYQAFNLARMNLDAFLDSHKSAKPVAVIVDADETVIDNSAYEAFLIGQNFGYSSKTWNPWMQAAQATAMPGALEFLKYAESRNVDIFYVTNRKMVGYEGTEKNLKALGFPNVDPKHLLLRTGSSDKQERRNMVEKDYEVALLMGDNHNDFHSAFRNKSVAERFAETDRFKDSWGTKFIVLPNPTYGDWEGSVYEGNWGASAAEKDQMRKGLLKRWNYQP